MSTSYKETLNLPQTAFPMKANLSSLEPELLRRWSEDQLYHHVVLRHQSEQRYILHDGPPYANGRLHLGHFLNKILKDIVVKYKNLSGFRCEFIPGWDCHGLPIEIEVDKKLGDKKRELTAVKKREACRTHAEEFIAIQREEFKRLGCFGRWDVPYSTMSPAYEATIVREFGKFVASGSLYKGKKPISWCPSCETALAEAEVEYEDRQSPSIYVKFQLENDGDVRQQWKLGDEPICLVIWTTTPWTLPANLGLALHPDFPYVALKVDGEVWIVAEGLKDQVMTATGKSFSAELGTFSARDLERKTAKHPLLDRSSLIILGEHVTLDAGTGVVHTAPGHGQEDYEVGLRYGLDCLAPIDGRGHFTAEAGLPWLTGIFVAKANKLIVEKLKECGALVHDAIIAHAYPHCWRCKSPIIFRATAQWFLSLEKHQLREKALAAIEQVEWIPTWGKNRIEGMMSARPDWCLSRQRVWGVPIVAVICEACEHSHTSPELVEKAAKIFAEEGSDAWFTKSVETFLPDGFACPQCGEAKRFRQERDILDVWFDSGVSYAAVLEEEEGITMPADLYLEGSDQHRGWFHTSLLTSVGTRGRAPYKRVLTHGFVVDGEGKKYSKSAKNYVPPDALLAKYGAEIVRLWVAAEDYRNDIRFSDEIIARVAESYRKIRNTCRYMLANLHDFHPAADAVSNDELLELDRWALGELERIREQILTSYESFDFHVIYHTLNRFCTVELSAFYFDILKDRLYAEGKKSLSRRAAQTVLWRLLEELVVLMAPILSFTAEEIWRYLPQQPDRPASVFLGTFPERVQHFFDPDLFSRWERLARIRGEVTKVLERARADKTIGTSLEAMVMIEVGAELADFLSSFGEALPDLFIVSQVEFGTASGAYVHDSEHLPGLRISVHKASGEKCARCWKYATTVGTDAVHPEICQRCAAVLKS